jgi:hypothetical protein
MLAIENLDYLNYYYLYVLDIYIYTPRKNVKAPRNEKDLISKATYD